MIAIVLLCIGCEIISSIAEKNKYKVLNICNAILFFVLSVFAVLGSNNPILVLACKNMINNDAYYKIIHESILESTNIVGGVFSVYFIIQLIAVAIASLSLLIKFIKGLKSISRDIVNLFKKVKKALDIRSDATSIETQKEHLALNSYIYLYYGALLI